MVYKLLVELMAGGCRIMASMPTHLTGKDSYSYVPNSSLGNSC